MKASFRRKLAFFMGLTDIFFKKNILINFEKCLYLIEHKLK